MLARLPDPTTRDSADALQATVAQMNRNLMEVERNRVVARQIELADEAAHHRMRDAQMARMTAFNANLIEEMANRPQSLPAAIAPSTVSNVTNIQNVTPVSYIENIQNIFQSTHNYHHQSLQL